MSYSVKNKPDLDGWVKVGTIGVDAGLCWIGDPCYVLHKSTKELEAQGLGSGWSSVPEGQESFCDKLEAQDEKKIKGVQQAYNFGGTGVAVSTGYGDGSYDVYVRYSDEGSWGKRIAEAKVVFIGDEDEEELCSFCGNEVMYCDCQEDEIEDEEEEANV